MVQAIAPKTFQNALQQTEAAIQAGQPDAALAYCQTILASFPESLEARRLLGEAHLAQGRLKDALQALDWVLANDPENASAYCDRAAVSERMLDIDTALDCYQQAYELSRGNSQIRQQFTQLSARIGQQGFVFSRAGLARLYMRGNLLSQAIQEWEAVLAVAPDRLDARTGLLETYWLEGSLDHVEEWAIAILQDVPHCLKALLLLAYVTALKDLSQAQLLLQQAEALDPDFSMAQELFADLIARAPDDPFLRLIRKSSPILNTSYAADSAPPANPAIPMAPNNAFSREESFLPVTGALVENGVLPQWGLQNNDEAFLAPFSSGQIKRDPSISALATDLESQSLAEPEMQPEPWELLQDALRNIPNVPIAEATPAQSVDVPQRPDLGDIEPLEAFKGRDQDDQDSQELDHWDSNIEPLHDDQSGVLFFDPDEFFPNIDDPNVIAKSRDNGHDSIGSRPDDQSVIHASIEDPSATYPAQFLREEGSEDTQRGGLEASPGGMPSWLSMLSQNDRQQMATPVPLPLQDEPLPQHKTRFTTPLEEIVPVEQMAPAAKTLPIAETSSVPQKAIAVDEVSSTSNDEEESLFGPAWLKSLGAQTLETEQNQPLEEVPIANSAQLSSSSSYEQWQISDMQGQMEAQSRAYASWQAAAQEVQQEIILEPEVKAQLAAFESWSSFDSMALPAPMPNPPEQTEQDIVDTLEGWEQQLQAQGFVALEPNSLSAIAQAEEAKSQVNGLDHRHEESERGTSMILPLNNQIYVENPKQPPIAFPSVPQTPRFVQELQFSFSSPQPTSSLTARPNPFLDSELETTMKRPAVRLESMWYAEGEYEKAPMIGQASEQTTVDPPDFSLGRDPQGIHNPSLSLPATAPSYTQQTSPIPDPSPRHEESKGVGPAQNYSAGTPGSSNAAANEHLLRGYQHQLAGDYDEAMQDYRLVIRTSSELLGEVISNLNALLKQAPHYSAASRVLGDAYMRQGEYLLAMEAYNNALNMTKKAKG